MARLIHPDARVHSRAVVHDDVQLGAGAQVWQFASVIRAAHVGARSVIASCAIVDVAFLGQDCHVGHGASVHPGALVGDRVFIGPGAVICNDRWPSVDKAGFDQAGLLAGEVVVMIGDGASIGANAVILPGVKVGKGAMVAAGAVVSAHVPEGFLWTRLGDLAALRETRGPRTSRPC